MSTPCPSCNKLCALNFEEPEIENDLEVDEEGTVTGTVRIVRTSECCGEEMKEAIFDIDWTPDSEGVKLIQDEHTGEGHELTLNADDPEQVEESGGRYKKSFFGASIAFRIGCHCQKEPADPLIEGEWSDKVSASSMDECC